MERREGLGRCRENVQLLQVFHLSTMNEVIEFVSPPVQLHFYFCRKSQTIVSFYTCKSMLFQRENFSLIFYVVGIIFITDYKITKCLQIFYPFSIKGYNDSQKVFAN